MLLFAGRDVSIWVFFFIYFWYIEKVFFLEDVCSSRISILKVWFKEIGILVAILF